MSFKLELDTYKDNLTNLLITNEGRFVVIKDDWILGVYDTYDDALDAGYFRFGVGPFLVKKIAPI